jgi:hypothetical protein
MGECSCEVGVNDVAVYVGQGVGDTDTVCFGGLLRQCMIHGGIVVVGSINGCGKGVRLKWGLGGSLVLAGLVQVPLGGCNGFWEMSRDSAGCEAWPRGELVVIDGLDPCGWTWTIT